MSAKGLTDLMQALELTFPDWVHAFIFARRLARIFANHIAHVVTLTCCRIQRWGTVTFRFARLLSTSFAHSCTCFCAHTWVLQEGPQLTTDLLSWVQLHERNATTVRACARVHLCLHACFCVNAYVGSGVRCGMHVWAHVSMSTRSVFIFEVRASCACACSSLIACGVLACMRMWCAVSVRQYANTRLHDTELHH